jgi:hypothetical protein
VFRENRFDLGSFLFRTLYPTPNYKKCKNLLTTGAMLSATPIALEAMLDLSPLPVMVKKEAVAQSAFRMLDT